MTADLYRMVVARMKGADGKDILGRALVPLKATRKQRLEAGLNAVAAKIVSEVNKQMEPQ